MRTLQIRSDMYVYACLACALRIPGATDVYAQLCITICASPSLLLIMSHPPEYGTHLPNELQASGCASKPHYLSTGVRSAASGLRLL